MKHQDRSSNNPMQTAHLTNHLLMVLFLISNPLSLNQVSRAQGYLVEQINLEAQSIEQFLKTIRVKKVLTETSLH
jgi:hypothetical protein